MRKPHILQLQRLILSAAWIGLTFCANPNATSAGPLQTFGFGGRAIAMGGAYAAEAEDYAAPFYNPAGMSFSDKPLAGAGFVYGSFDLQFNGHQQDTRLVRAWQVGGTFPLGTGTFLSRCRFGAAIHLPTKYLYEDVASQDAQTPHFVFYLNHPHRIAILLCGSYQILPTLSVGGGVSVQGGLDLFIDLDVLEVGETFLNFGARAPYKLSPVAGLRFKPNDRFALALVYRGQSEMRIWTEVELSILGSEELIPMFTAYNHNMYKPHEIVAGAMVRPTDRIVLDLDLTWINYEQLLSPAPKYRWKVAPLVVQMLGLKDYSDPGFDDVFVPRLGMEFRMNRNMAFRAGYSYQPTPVPNQAGATNYLDSDKHIASLGAGFTFEDPLGLMDNPLNIDLSFQWHILEKRTIEKADPTDELNHAELEGKIYFGSIFLKYDF